MRADLPYHFCAVPACREMVDPRLTFCADHALCWLGDPGHDLFLADIETSAISAPSREALSPAACQGTNQSTSPVPGDAGLEKSQ